MKLGWPAKSARGDGKVSAAAALSILMQSQSNFVFICENGQISNLWLKQPVKTSVTARAGWAAGGDLYLMSSLQLLQLGLHMEFYVCYFRVEA